MFGKNVQNSSCFCHQSLREFLLEKDSLPHSIVLARPLLHVACSLVVQQMLKAARQGKAGRVLIDTMS